MRWASKGEKVVRQMNVPTEVEPAPTYLETDGNHPPCHSVARIDSESIHSEVSAMETEERDDFARACAYSGYLT